MDQLNLGIDLGTTSVKVVLASGQGQVFRSVVHASTADVASSIGNKGSEQDVGKIVQGLVNCLESLTPEERSRISRIGITGQMHGVVLWNSQNLDTYFSGVSKDSEGMFKTTSNLFTWQDQRCHPEFLASLPASDSHVALATGYGCATLFWLASNEPEILERFDCAGSIMDFIVAVLCQLPHPVMTPQLAASWGYFNCRTSQWNDSQLHSQCFPHRLLPKIVQSGEVAGRLCSDWLGIQKGTPVLAGLGDLQCAVYSSLKGPNFAVLNMSTSCQLAFPIMHLDVLPLKPELSSSVQYFPYFKNSILAVAASLNGGNVLTHYVKMITKWMTDLGAKIDENVLWEKLTESAVNVDEKDLPQIHPTIYGERHSPNLLGSMKNITPDNFDLGAIFKSMSQGLVKNIQDMMCCDDLEKNGITKLICTGSLTERNQWIRHKIEEVFRSLTLEFGGTCDSALGAAIVIV